jgi:uncharacterized protein (TIGR02453 family)
MSADDDVPAFEPSLFRFLRDLRKNNDRDWFLANKERYEREVRDPALRFIASFAAPLRRIHPQLVADPRPVGGSLFRIHRDVRFAKDKRPYKTHVGIHFRSATGAGAHAPGLYLHLEPGDVYAGVGIWRPDGATLSEVRDALVADERGWRRAVAGRAFRTLWALSGETLKRPPRGYDPEHPLADDLKRKEYVAITGFDERDACAPDFAARLEQAWRAGAPLLRFLTRALDRRR